MGSGPPRGLGSLRHSGMPESCPLWVQPWRAWERGERTAGATSLLSLNPGLKARSSRPPPARHGAECWRNAPNRVGMGGGWGGLALGDSARGACSCPALLLGHWLAAWSNLNQSHSNINTSFPAFKMFCFPCKMNHKSARGAACSTHPFPPPPSSASEGTACRGGPERFLGRWMGAAAQRGFAELPKWGLSRFRLAFRFHSAPIPSAPGAKPLSAALSTGGRACPIHCHQHGHLSPPRHLSGPSGPSKTRPLGGVWTIASCCLRHLGTRNAAVRGLCDKEGVGNGASPKGTGL